MPGVQSGWQRNHLYPQSGIWYIEERESALTRLAMEELQKLPFVHILGSDQAAEHHGILSFTVEGVHPHDVARSWMQSRSQCGPDITVRSRCTSIWA